MMPPKIARMLLIAVAGENEAEFVAGDLEEEYVLVYSTRGFAIARRWYASQVLRSLASLIGMRIRSSDWSCALMTGAVSIALPVLLLDQLWRFVYSQIPLKDGLDRAPAFLLANLLLIFASSALRSLKQRGLAPPIAAVLWTGVALWASPGVTPLWYVSAAVLAAASTSIFHLVRRKPV